MTTTDQDSEFAVVDTEQLEKAQKIITMIKEQDEFSADEADEIIGFIYDKLGMGSQTA